MSVLELPDPGHLKVRVRRTVRRRGTEMFRVPYLLDRFPCLCERPLSCFNVEGQSTVNNISFTVTSHYHIPMSLLKSWVDVHERREPFFRMKTQC